MKFSTLFTIGSLLFSVVTALPLLDGAIPVNRKPKPFRPKIADHEPGHVGAAIADMIIGITEDIARDKAVR